MASSMSTLTLGSIASPQGDVNSMSLLPVHVPYFGGEHDDERDEGADFVIWERGICGLGLNNLILLTCELVLSSFCKIELDSSSGMANRMDET